MILSNRCELCGSPATTARPALWDDPPLALCESCDVAMPPPRPLDGRVLATLSCRDYSKPDPAPAAPGAKRVVCSTTPDQPCDWLQISDAVAMTGFVCSGNASTGELGATAAGVIDAPDAPDAPAVYTMAGMVYRAGGWADFRVYGPYPNKGTAYNRTACVQGNLHLREWGVPAWFAELVFEKPDSHYLRHQLEALTGGGEPGFTRFVSRED